MRKILRLGLTIVLMSILCTFPVYGQSAAAISAASDVIKLNKEAVLKGGETLDAFTTLRLAAIGRAAGADTQTIVIYQNQRIIELLEKLVAEKK